MNRKITAFIMAFISILSIVIVTLFGIKAGRPIVSVPVEDIMFVDREGGTEENRITTRYTEINTTHEELEEIMELYYYVLPYNATNKGISVIFSAFNDANENKVEKYLLNDREGVIVLDFKGCVFEMFEVTIVSKEKFTLTQKRTFSINFKEE